MDVVLSIATLYAIVVAHVYSYHATASTTLSVELDFVIANNDY